MKWKDINKIIKWTLKYAKHLELDDVYSIAGATDNCCFYMRHKVDDWIGQDCKYFAGRCHMEKNKTGDLECPDCKDCNPVLFYCTHPENESDFEWNCNARRCPSKMSKLEEMK